MKKIAALVLMLVMASSIFAGCSQKKPTGKFLRVAKDVELASMDQHVATDGLSFDTIAGTTEGLYSMDKDGNLIEAIAKSYSVSDDNLVYTFTLREDAKWSNGDAVTAKDFVYSWRRLVNPDTASEYNFIADVAGIKNAAKIVTGEIAKEELGVKAEGDNTLVVELERPTPYFLSLTAFPTFFPLNEAFVEEQGDQYALEPNNLLANGPYIMTEWKKGYGFKLEKNPDYYDKDAVNIQGLEFRVIKDHQTAVLKYENNELDVVQLTAELVERYKSDSGYTQIPAGYLWYLSPNFDVELFSNANARKALSHAVNKEHIATKILNDGSRVADFIVPIELATGPDGKDFRQSTGTYCEYDKDKALDYWNKAKAELGEETYEVELLFDDFEAVKKIAEFVQAELENNLPGLTVNLKAQPKKNRIDLMRDGDYDLGITRWGPDYADPLTYLELFVTGGINNYPNYSSSVFDQLVNDSSRGSLSSDPNGRWAAMIEAERVMLEEDAACVPLYQRGFAFLINEKVSGIETHTVGVPFIYKNVKISD